MARNNVEFITDLAALVRKHYPDGHMRADDVVTYFGMVIAGAVANQPEAVRDRAARAMAHLIRFPDKALKGLV